MATQNENFLFRSYRCTTVVKKLCVVSKLESGKCIRKCDKFIETRTYRFFRFVDVEAKEEHAEEEDATEQVLNGTLELGTSVNESHDTEYFLGGFLLPLSVAVLIAGLLLSVEN